MTPPTREELFVKLKEALRPADKMKNLAWSQTQMKEVRAGCSKANIKYAELLVAVCKELSMERAKRRVKL